MKDFSTHAIKSPTNASQNYFLETFCDGKQVLFPVMQKVMERILNLYIFSSFKHFISAKQTCLIPVIIPKLFALDSSILDKYRLSYRLLILIWILDGPPRGLVARSEGCENAKICPHVLKGLSCLDSNTLLKTQFRSNFIISMRALGFT